MANYFGIDFGTTNSAVVATVAVDGEVVGEVRRIGEDERHPLPSFVAIHKKTGDIRKHLLVWFLITTIIMLSAIPASIKSN